MSDYTKSLIQVWIVILVSGTIGITAFAWNGNYEKGSAIDLIKTQITKHQEVK